MRYYRWIRFARYARRRDAETMKQFFSCSLAVVGIALAAGSEVRAGDKSQAIVGSPLGVGTFSVDLTAETKYIPDARNFVLTETNGRVVYPVFSSNGQIMKTIVQKKLRIVTVHFLFRGDEPLQIQLKTRDGQSFEKKITPLQQTSKDRKLLTEWWELYSKRVDFLARNHKFPQVVDNYLVGMLARRMGFDVPKFKHRWSSYNEYDLLIGTFLGTQSIRGAMQRDTFLKSTKRTERATMALPKAVTPPAVTIPAIPDDVAIEPIAMRVPADCFYIRCGNYTNFRWMRSNIDVWGSQIRDVVETQAQTFRVQEHLERQLALKETTLAVVFGDSIVSDIAVIGADTFLSEGGAVGVIFETKGQVERQVLQDQLKKLRDESLIQNPDARTGTIHIDGHEVTLVSTADNRVRSFTAIDGDYLLVTNSRTIMRDFLRTRTGENSLGKLKEFRHIRNLMPLSRNDTCFVYLSDPFFRRLVSPHYRVEMTRRMQADSEIELVQVARLAARAEDRPHDSIDDLVDGGFVPSNFAVRPDGSRTVMIDGKITDSQRGARGSLLPVPDVQVEHVTQSEFAAYMKFAQFYRRLWQRMDPATIAIKRKSVENGREQVVFDVHITPYLRRNLGFLLMFLAPPSKQHIAKVDGDVLAVQGVLNSNILGGPGQGKKPYNVFGAFHEFDIDFDVIDGAVTPTKPLSEEFFYAGSTPKLRIFDQNLGTIKPDADGYAELKKTGWPFAKAHWIRQWNNFRVHGPRLDLLKEVTPQIRLEEAERTAQIRVRVGDLSKTSMADFMHAHGYVNARMISGTNVEFLNRLMDQLNVKPGDALSAAESILAARLTCSLGGTYRLNQRDNELNEWRSTAWATQCQSEVNSIPDGYRYPVLDWIHGLELEFSLDATTLKARMELEVDPAAMRNKHGSRFSLRTPRSKR